ncbi:MAG TPA: tetratricopeptide repeat protein [Xanthobacteraceae bacterium]|nr:tetratricopeptide repeat protein [Xanthobacteraceae bacterium]
MDAQGDSAAKVSRSRALVLRETKMMAAVQVRSIEFRPFVESAVANLIDNTPDKRGEIYARARGVVKRRLQLLRLPAPIAELERLALDLTIRKIERRWRAREAAKRAVPQKRPERPLQRNAAARVRSIEFRPFVERAVANLIDNTPDKRREVYARARGVVKRRLQLLRLPAPIAEFERLALDLTIQKIERRWRAREAAKRAVPQKRPEPPPLRNAAAHAFTLFAEALKAFGTFLRLVVIAVLGHRPKIAAIGFFTRSRLWPKTPPMATTIGKVERRWLALEPPKRAAPRIPLKRRTKRNTATQTFGFEAHKAVRTVLRFVLALRSYVTATVIPAGLLRPLAKSIAVAALPTVAAIILFGHLDNTVTYRSVVDGPVGRWLSGRNGEPSAIARDAPAAATMSAGCSGSSISERAACARYARGSSAEAESPWHVSFVALGDATSGRASMPLVSPPVSTENVAARAAAPIAPPSEPAQILLIEPANPKVTVLIESGKRASLAGDLDHALRDFNEAIRIDPKYPDSYSERGQTLFKLGQIERAMADYAAALMRDPQHVGALRARAMAYLQGGKTDLALAELSKAIELAERDPRPAVPIELFHARRTRAAVYDSRQQYDLEIADCTALIDSYAANPMLVAALTASYGSVGAADIRTTIYRQRANAFIKKSSSERPVADLTQAIPLGSNQGYAPLIDRSKVNERLDQDDEADAPAALSVRPGSEEARRPALERLGAPPKPTSPNGL